MNIERFNEACEIVKTREKPAGGIGTLSEKSLHSVLKYYFEPCDERHEIRIGGFIADAVGENGIIEVQTRSLYGMDKKLDAFLSCCNVTVVFPIVRTKRLIWIDPQTGETRTTRCGQRSRTVYEALHDIYFIRKYIDNPRFSLCIVMLEADDYRIAGGKSKSRRRCVCDRFPTAIVDEIYLSSPRDYLNFLPNGLPEEFISADVARLANIHISNAQSLLYLLNEYGLAERIGKRGNSYIYKISQS